jgi:4-alpha-glucanotransferase
MRLPRASGILLHITSLPGRFGIGDLGPEAYSFVDLLVETGQRWWQILPLNPTGYDNSPYQSYSSFAGNPLLISPEGLAEAGWLVADDLSDYPSLPSGHVDFEGVVTAKERILRRAFERFRVRRLDFDAFHAREASWLHDFSVYMALKEVHGGRPWYQWDPELAHRRPEALAEASHRLADVIFYHQFVQYAFDRQWRVLREACAARDVQFIGDVPIFVAWDSADVWARPDLFRLDDHGRPTVVAGVPPDYFSAEGQLWGNPLYRWEAHAAEGFAWWIARMRAAIQRVDLVRLDHFRGFEAYWEVPADAPTAATGRWVKAPGAALLNTLRTALGGLPIIAEDLGVITPEVEALRDDFGLPGMRILQFGFNTDPTADFNLPQRYINHCIAYTGTHDNDTIVGWFTTRHAHTTQPPEEIEAERAFALRYLGTGGTEIHWDMIRVLLASVADTVIFPLQDVLGLGSNARMNVPGTAVGNWTWRVEAGQLHKAIVDRLAEQTAVYHRWNGDVPEAHSPYRPR